MNPLCPEASQLSDEDHSKLQAAGHLSAEPEVWGCGLWAGHAGLHAANAADETNETLWMVWLSGGVPALMRRDPCDAVDTDDEAYPCMMPTGHDGDHDCGSEGVWSRGDNPQRLGSSPRDRLERGRRDHAG
jgi:hypothetical protein